MIFAGYLLAAGLTIFQASSVGIDQIGAAPRSQAAAQPQLTQGPRTVTAAPPASPATERGATANASPQLTTNTRGGAVSSPTPQLSVRGGAAPSPAISTTAQGRAVRTAPVGGSDRCDPRSGSNSATVCQHVIEGRADEFAQAPPPAAPQSAEQQNRLLQPNDPDAAARRLAQGGVTGSEAAQAVAAGLTTLPPSVLGVNGVPGATGGASGVANAGVDAQTTALVNSIVAGFTNAGATGITVIPPSR